VDWLWFIKSRFQGSGGKFSRTGKKKRTEGRERKTGEELKLNPKRHFYRLDRPVLGAFEEPELEDNAEKSADDEQ
jgi:hypothetical protein